jgi:bifunctional DNA-binding transcriptional regulator/antitoxin component of YhaV-PrlF toxin-antitoxin module
LREKHNLKEGDSLHVMDLGGGALVLTPTRSRIPELSESLEQIREAEDVSIDDMLADLREERRRGEEESSD